MKNRLIVLTVFVIFVFFSACDEDSDEISVKDKIFIAGTEFTPTDNQITKNNDGFDFSFSDSDNSILISTNDTVQGAYTVIIENTVKYANLTELEATISYTNGSIEYKGKSGSIEIVILEDGSISVSFNVTLEDAGGNEIIIDGEDFIIESQNITDNTETVSNYLLIDGTNYDLSGGIFNIMTGAVTDEPSYVSSIYLYSDGISYSEVNSNLSGIGTMIEIDLYSATNEFTMGSYAYDTESNYYSGTFDGGYTFDLNVEGDWPDGIEFTEGNLIISSVSDEYEITLNSGTKSLYYKGRLTEMIDD